MSGCGLPAWATGSGWPRSLRRWRFEAIGRYVVGSRPCSAERFVHACHRNSGRGGRRSRTRPRSARSAARARIAQGSPGPRGRAGYRRAHGAGNPCDLGDEMAWLSDDCECKVVLAVDGLVVPPADPRPRGCCRAPTRDRPAAGRGVLPGEARQHPLIPRGHGRPAQSARLPQPARTERLQRTALTRRPQVYRRALRAAARRCSPCSTVPTRRSSNPCSARPSGANPGFNSLATRPPSAARTPTRRNGSLAVKGAHVINAAIRVMAEPALLRLKMAGRKGT
jgi:hypothetical protein